MSILRLELLGGLRVRQGEQQVNRFRTQKAASLLCYLALHPQRQFSREELALLLWPDAPDESARVSLRTALSHLRAALGDGVLQQEGNRTVGLGPVQTDVVAFEQAVAQKRWPEARQLYTGELLPGFWDEWIVTERERLAALWDQVPQSENTPTARPTLPLEADRFWGRDTELAQLATDLDEARVVSLLGPGGMGKTRLALAAARRYSSLFPGGTWFVPLAALREPRLIVAALRDSLGIAPHPRQSPLDQVVAFLQSETRCLLILDNLEQLAAGAASELRPLLERVPNLHLLVTTRRRLGLPQERQHSLGSLSSDDSAQLFRDRARQATSNPLPADDIHQLCLALEGIPLALELAAARCASLTVAQIHARLSERFALLITNTEEKSARHRSLHATIAWSFTLLTPEQRRVFLTVATFRGGWTTEAAEAICDDPTALEYLAQLRERSLVNQDHTGRWHQLESLRAFAQAQPADHETPRQRHFEYYLALARTGDPDSLATERENLRAALEHAEPAQHTDLAFALAPHWLATGNLDEAKPALEKIRRVAAAPADQVKALTWLIDLYEHRGDAAMMLHTARRITRLARQSGDLNLITCALISESMAYNFLRQPERAMPLAQTALSLSQLHTLARPQQRAHNSLAIAAYFLNDYPGAIHHFTAALELAQQSADRASIAQFHANLGVAYLGQENYSEARRHLEETLTNARREGDLYQHAMQASNLAWVACLQEDWEGAVALNREALTVAAQISAHLTLRNVLWIRALIDAEQGNAERAARLFGAAERLTATTGTPMTDDDLARQADREARFAVTLGTATLAQYKAEGHALPLTDAIALALA